MRLGHKIAKGLGVVAALFVGFALAGAATVATWTELMPAGVPPSTRGGHSAVLDETTNRLIVFGGRAAGVLVNEVWILTGANGTAGPPTWVQLNPSGTPPLPRIGHTAVYDAGSSRMIVFGGTTENFRLDDAWVLTNANGTEPTTPTWL